MIDRNRDSEIKSEYKPYYQEDKLYITKRFIAYNIPVKIRELYLDNLLMAYLNIDDISFTSVMRSITVRITYMPDGDPLTIKQRQQIQECTTYLERLYNTRFKKKR